MATLKTRIQIRRAKEAEWEEYKSVVLAEGEWAMVTDGEHKGQVKLGDGVTTWEFLPYFAGDYSGELPPDFDGLPDKVAALSALVGTKPEETEIVATDLWGAVEEIYDDLKTNYYTKPEVDEKIKTATGSVYIPSGSIAFESLPELTEAELGKVYNITNAFITTEDFVEGAGLSYAKGTNVMCVQVEGPAYKWDTLGGEFDTSNLVTSEKHAEDLEKKVDKEASKSLVADTLIEKLNALANIKTVSSEFTLSPEGELSVQAVNVSKLVQTPGDTLVLDGGDSTTPIA